MSELIVYKLGLDVSHPGCEKQVNLKSEETNSRILHITLTDGSEAARINPATDIAIMRGIKPDKTIAFNSATITNSGIVEYAFTDQDTAIDGDGFYEVQIIRVGEERNSVLYSAWFKVCVGERLYQDEKITSVNEYTALTEAIAAAKKATENMYMEVGREVAWTTVMSSDSPIATSTSSKIYCDKFIAKYTHSDHIIFNVTEYDLEGNSINTENITHGVLYEYQIKEEGNYIVLRLIQTLSSVGAETDVTFDGLTLKYYLYQKRYFETYCVPKTRTIAGINLKNDITAVNLAKKLGETSTFGLSVVEHMKKNATGYLGSDEVIEAFGNNANLLFNSNAEKIFELSGVQIELNKQYVQIIRKIAGLDLEDDITAKELADALTKDSEAFKVLNTFTGKIATAMIAANGNINSNTSARHTHKNKDLLDTLTEDVLNNLLKIEVTKEGTVTNLSITDKNGTTNVSINDGVVPIYDEESDYVVFKNAQNVDSLVDAIYGGDE